MKRFWLVVSSIKLCQRIAARRSRFTLLGGAPARLGAVAELSVGQVCGGSSGAGRPAARSMSSSAAGASSSPPARG